MGEMTITSRHPPVSHLSGQGQNTQWDWGVSHIQSFSEFFVPQISFQHIKNSSTFQSFTMLRSISRLAIGRSGLKMMSATAPVAVRSTRTLSSGETKAYDVTYDSMDDLGSYKNSYFTHRLPESTAEQSPDLVALHARLELPKEFSYLTLSQALNLVLSDEQGLANNFGLATIGKLLLGYYVTEHLLFKYPRLPIRVFNAVVDSYMGYSSLTDVGKLWGIQIERSTNLDKYLAQEPFYLKYGRLRYLSNQELGEIEESGVRKVSAESLAQYQKTNRFVPELNKAYSSAVNAIIGGVYTSKGEVEAKKFIDQHILSRQVPIEQMFKFKNPFSELIKVCAKEGFTDPIELRLVAETGRLSPHPIFVVGAFAGTEKLGEGVGGSLNEAKTRASVNALMSFYLYLPMASDGGEVKSPSAEDGYKLEPTILTLGDA